MAIVVPLVLIARLRLELLLVPAVFLVLLGITIWDYNRRLNPVSDALREQFGEMNAGLAEAVAGIEVVKANVQERYEWYKFTQNARCTATTTCARARSRRATGRPAVFSRLPGRRPSCTRC